MIARPSVSLPSFRIGPFHRDAAVIGLLGSLTLLGVVAGVGRLLLGLAASTALSDGYSWGIWIGFDFTLIAFAGVGFTMAFLVHVVHIHRLQPVLRPALLAGFAGYVAVLLLLVLDLGRPDRFYSFIINWNFHSPLFEISWCVLLYTTVLFLELSPDCCRWLGWSRLTPWLQRLITPVTILGVTLSTLHQSTLGTLYLNMPHRLDPLWYSPWLPVLFFTSAVMAGCSLAIVIYKLACRVLERAEDARIPMLLGRCMTTAALLYLTLKAADFTVAGEWSRVLGMEPRSLLMLTELVPCLVVPLLFWRLAARWQAAAWGAPLLFLAGVGLNRFSATMFGQNVPSTVSYAPHILEWLATLGILAGAALLWYLGVRYLTEEPSVAH